MTARFWVYWNGGIARLALGDGEFITLHECHRHDEGYSRTVETYSRRGDTLTREIETSGRDCDGPSSESSVDTVRIDRLAEVYNEYAGISYPAWATKRSRRYDAYAEAAGY